MQKVVAQSRSCPYTLAMKETIGEGKTKQGFDYTVNKHLGGTKHEYFNLRIVKGESVKVHTNKRFSEIMKLIQEN